jgi:hypothetical protein
MLPLVVETGSRFILIIFLLNHKFPEKLSLLPSILSKNSSIVGAFYHGLVHKNFPVLKKVMQ